MSPDLGAHQTVADVWNDGRDIATATGPNYAGPPSRLALPHNERTIPQAA